MSRQIMPDTYTFILAAVIGLALGGVLSLLFGRSILPTRIPFEVTIFGFPSGVIMANLLIVAIVGAVVVFGYLAMVVQDTQFPREHPLQFLIELLIVSFVPASVIYVMTDFRDNGKIDFPALHREFMILAAKFGLFHLLFQFSGFYSYSI
jgi:glycerol uptake facilitator-like aquaporin